MPFVQSQTKKFTPKELKFSELYKHVSKGKELAGTAKVNAMKALASSGYSQSEISKIMSGNLSSMKAKQVMAKLAKTDAAEFKGQDANRSVNAYLHKEAIKKKNIAGRRTELMQEALQEDIYQSKQTGKGAGRIGGISAMKKTGGIGRPRLGF